MYSINIVFRSTRNLTSSFFRPQRVPALTGLRIGRKEKKMWEATRASDAMLGSELALNCLGILETVLPSTKN